LHGHASEERRLPRKAQQDPDQPAPGRDREDPKERIRSAVHELRLGALAEAGAQTGIIEDLARLPISPEQAVATLSVCVENLQCAARLAQP
jgi:hypothetical protein